MLRHSMKKSPSSSRRSLYKTAKLEEPKKAGWLRILRELSTTVGLATAFDLAAFRLSMIAPVKKSVNHPKTVASMRGTGWENNKFNSS